MFGWVVSQMLAFAVGRALLPLQSRYFDILLIGTTINFVSAFWLFQRDAPRRRSLMTWRSFALAAWLLVLALSLTRPQRHLPDQIEEWRTMLATGSKNVQSYLATGDSSFIFRVPGAEVPSFAPKRLRELLDTPEDLLRPAANVALGQCDTPMGRSVQEPAFSGSAAVWIAIGTLLLTATGRSVAALPATRPDTRLAVSSAPETVDLHNA